MKTKNKLVVRRIAINEEAKNIVFWSKKDTSKVKNTLLQWILQNILESQTFQRIAKFIMIDSYEMDFMEGIVILVKLDEMYNIFKPASHCLLVERWRWNWMIKVFAGACRWRSIHLLRPCFIKRQASSCKRYGCRESVWYCNTRFFFL